MAYGNLEQAPGRDWRCRGSRERLHPRFEGEETYVDCTEARFIAHKVRRV